jgi:hypothetical protein
MGLARERMLDWCRSGKVQARSQGSSALGLAAVGNVFQAVIDAFEAFDDHPEDPDRKDVKDAPDGEHRDKICRYEFSHARTSDRAYTRNIRVIKAYPRTGDGGVTNLRSGT